MDKVRLLQDLQKKQDIIADSYDGSYELVREIISSYEKLDDYSEVSYLDMNAIYLMAIGTWKINVQKKKEKIALGCLPDTEKQRLYEIIDKVWDNACKSQYSYKEDTKKPTIGMFGTGFYSFENKTTKECAQKFVEMLVDIKQESEINEDIIFSKVEKVINGSFKGMKAASASVVLHCLMPNVFPVINGNMGSGNIFVALGIDIKKPEEIATYIANCRKIKEYRDSYLPFKNYRVLDVMAWELPKYETNEYIPSFSEYDPKISSDKYIEIFQDESIIKKTSLDTVYLIYLMGGEASCKQLENKYGESFAHYNANAIVTAKAVHGYTNCELSSFDNDGDNYWSILFQGRKAKSGEEGVFFWKLRPQLSTAISELEEAGFFEDVIVKENNTTFNHNTILYGPPGTGKTYSTARYAVQICDGNKTVNLDDYDAVMARYRELMDVEHRIAFVTFHQSYGYEEFIEGIKPLMSKDIEQLDSNQKKELKYDIVDGSFKMFCKEACREEIRTDKFSISDSSRIWKTTVRTEVMRDCFENNRIRIDWSIDSDGAYGFVNDIHQGDIVLITDGSRSVITGIAVVTKEEAYSLQTESDKTTRDVQWLAKDINENIVEINDGKILHRKTVARVPSMLIGDIIKVSMRYNSELEDTKIIRNNKPYVFIIDEINRGNISKIFGELITLIEDTKRAGMKECIPATLPYSNEKFTVPQNVFILGTMNTADRSIALMDTALRRRFSFIEMLPRTELLDDVVVSANGESVNVGLMLRKINKRIERLYDREHMIGHAPFMKLKEDPSIDKLADIFAKSVIPLLQEYFYEDYAKIRMVLGDNAKESVSDQFIVETSFGWDEDFLGNQPEEIDIPESTYEIKYENFKNIRCYKGIIEKL